MKQLLFLLAIAIATIGYSQDDNRANPYSDYIEPDNYLIELGKTTTVRIGIGNSGADLAGIGSCAWNISFPEVLRIDKNSLDFGTTTGILDATWHDDPSGVTYLRVDLIDNLDPKSDLELTINVKGVKEGGPAVMTLNNLHDPRITGNTAADDDNANGVVVVRKRTTVLVEQHQVKAIFEVSPNPVIDRFTIKDNRTNEPGLKKLNMYDMSGRLVDYRTLSPESKEHPVQIRDMADGMYILNAIDEKGETFTNRLIKSQNSINNN